MLRSRSLRWRSIAIKTTIFVVVIIALRVAFTTNAVSSSLPLLSRPAVVKSYPSAPADIELRPGAISMMIVGDSLTQGSEGDWTWRYRLWEWLKSQEVLVDFVGPFLGTRPTTASLDELIVPEPLGLPPTGTATDTTGGYAIDIDPEFNSRHFSAVGRAIWQDMDLISAMVKRYNPEYLLVLLGFNDLAWSATSYRQDLILKNMEKFVANARAAKPDVKFAIGNVPHRSRPDDDLPERIDNYNKLLAEAIPKWSTDISPIEFVHMREGFSCEVGNCPAGTDGLHPNTLGDFEIAQAFSRALITGFKIGTTELAVPDPWDLPVRPISTPKNLKAVAGAHGVNVTWDKFYGAKGYEVQSRVLGEQPWILWPSQPDNRFHTAWNEEEFIEMEFKVRMNIGDREEEKGEWSGIVATCRPWSSLTSKEKWDWRWWYRRLWACSWRQH